MAKNFNEYDNEDWKRIKPFLKKISAKISPFAKKHNLQVECNYHNWPSFGLEWFEVGVRKYAQIWLEDGKMYTFTFWICASKDNLWKNEHLFRNLPSDEMIKILSVKLEEAYEILSNWKINDLEKK